MDIKDLTTQNEKRFTSYDDFLDFNRKRFNYVINKILWFSVSSGFLIALGIFFGAFKHLTYKECVLISISLVILSAIHLVLCKYFPSSPVPTIFALFTMDVMIYNMEAIHVDIFITYFVVPLTSLFFCSVNIYIISCILNLIFIILSNWNIATYQHNLMKDYYATPFDWFLGCVGGYIIEYFIMFGIGYGLCHFINDYFKRLYQSNLELSIKEREISKQYDQLVEIAKLSRIDNLTGVYNRTTYETDIAELKSNGSRDDLVFILANIDKLKITNDQLGHIAGDEQIIATADCLKKATEKIGKIYRISGDEFMVIAHTYNDVSRIRDHIYYLIENWRGKAGNTFAVSVGYVCAKDYPDASIHELEKMAHTLMFVAKQDHYINGNKKSREDS